MSRARLVALGAFLCFGCSRSPEPCLADSCGHGRECLVQRCVQTGADPVPDETVRIALEPTAMGLVTERREQSELASSVTFGSASFGASSLYVRFGDDWKTVGQVERAFLVLWRAPGSETRPEGVPVEAGVVVEPWETGELAWDTRPTVGVARAKGIAKASTLRIDVTRLTSQLSDRTPDFGLVVLCTEDEGLGIAYSTGVLQQRPPLLEVYVRR